jgi:acyl-CoA thioester hydrolase
MMACPQPDGRNPAMSNKKWVHIARMPIRWGDMDAMGHVNNTIYFRYFEQARVEWLESTGHVSEPESGEGPVVVSAHCSFLRQLRYPGDIEVRMAVGKLGRSSIETVQQIVRVDAPELICAEGAAKIVWANYREERSVPLPGPLRSLLEQD